MHLQGLQAFDVLDLFSAQVMARSRQLAESTDVPADMLEAISSLVYAAHRIGQVIPRPSVIENLRQYRSGQVMPGPCVISDDTSED